MTTARQRAQQLADTKRQELEAQLAQLQATVAPPPPARRTASVPIGDTSAPTGPTSETGADLATRMVTQPIDITLIDADPDQARKFPAPFSVEDPGKGVEELAASIRERGLLQPILVHRHEGRFKVLVGERRWRAFRLLAALERGSWTHIPAIEWAGPTTPVVVLAMQIIENDHREDHDPVARREAYLRLKQLCAGNASQAIRMLGIGRVTWYRVTGEADPDAGAAANSSRPKAASRLSFGQLTRALETFEDDRLDKLNPKQVSDLAVLVDRILTRLREKQATFG